MNRADSYQAGRADGERMGERDLRDSNLSHEWELAADAQVAQYWRVLGERLESEAAYRLGVLRGYRQVTR